MQREDLDRKKLDQLFGGWKRLTQIANDELKNFIGLLFQDAQTVT